MSDHQVTLLARNEWEPGPAASEPPLRWGLKGLRERVLLTGGSFSAYVDGRLWCVTLTLPHE